jgi:hypothetical protein
MSLIQTTHASQWDTMHWECSGTQEIALAVFINIWQALDRISFKAREKRAEQHGAQPTIHRGKMDTVHGCEAVVLGSSIAHPLFIHHSFIHSNYCVDTDKNTEERELTHLFKRCYMNEVQSYHQIRIRFAWNKVNLKREEVTRQSCGTELQGARFIVGVNNWQCPKKNVLSRVMCIFTITFIHKWGDANSVIMII